MPTNNHVFDAVLDEFSVPHVEERMPLDFFYQHGLAYPLQYAIACRDVADCVRRAESVGAGPFLHATFPVPNWTERGELIRNCKLEVALGHAGDRQLEFLGPGLGTQHYSGALVDTDIAFHHVGIYQRGMQELAAKITGAGYPEVIRGGVSFGRALSFDFRYFDTRADYGIYLELQDFSVLYREVNLESILHAYAKLNKLRNTLPF